MDYVALGIYRDPNTYSGTIGALTIQLRKIIHPVSRQISYMVIVQSESMPATTFFMKELEGNWVIKNKNAALLFGYLESQLNELIDQCSREISERCS